MNGNMLPPLFIDWWFAPWKYADQTLASFPHARDELALRDGYRLWCDRKRVAPDLPARFDPAWHIACSTAGDRLLRSARLFAGLFAARDHDQALLNQLSLADRKWCAGIASLQPVRSAQTTGSDMEIELRGLAELAIRLESDFPGMWSRLRLLLPNKSARAVDSILASSSSAEQANVEGQLRAQRCWQMCQQRCGDMK